MRRAQLLLAAGGDPRRALDPAGRAVSSVASDLDSAAARSQLRAGLAGLAADATELTEVEAACARLLAEPDLAWQWFACALLADALSE